MANRYSDGNSTVNDGGCAMDEQMMAWLGLSDAVNEATYGMHVEQGE